MTFENRHELVETIDEIFPRLDALKRDSTDIKAISDVLLALEKITPDIQKKLPIFLSEIPVSFSKLFEKLLMEPVENAEAGLKLAADGLAIVKRAVEGENPTDLVDGAENVLLKLSAGFKITSPAVADMVVTKEEAGKATAPTGPDNLILNAADEVLELLGLSTKKPTPKLRDKQLDAEDIFAQALASKGEEGKEPAEEEEEKPQRWTPESGEPPPISQTGRFRDIINLLERGVPAPEEEPEQESPPAEGEEDQDENAIEQIRSILEGRTDFPGHDAVQPETESTLEKAKESASKPRKTVQPSPERQADAEAVMDSVFKKAGKPEEHLEPDGRRQMEAEAALEHTRELSKEPTREADWSPEME
ncbi:MAG: hypothetical protein OEV92_10950, partial [Nitrospinota bacterium]|nr:hypothetical protein [Nitrospinota bacterium]